MNSQNVRIPDQSGNQKIRTAVIGVGYLGNFHAQKLKAITSSDLVGVYDFSSDQTKKIADSLGVKAFKSLEECLAEVDAVTIASTTLTHADNVRSALLAGKHVNVEKPMTATSETGKDLLALAEERKLIFTVGQIERFNPCFTWLKKYLSTLQAQGEIVLSFELQRLAPFRLRGSDVSVVQDLLIHDVDLMTWFQGDEKVQRIGAYGHRLIADDLDFVQVEAFYKSGVKYTIHVNRCAPQMTRFCRVITSKHVIEINSQTMEVQISEAQGRHNDPPCRIEKIQIEKADALFLENENFIQSILKKVAPVAPANQAFQSLLLCEDIEKSIHQKKYLQSATS